MRNSNKILRVFAMALSCVLLVSCTGVPYDSSNDLEPLLGKIPHKIKFSGVQETLEAVMQNEYEVPQKKVIPRITSVNLVMDTSGSMKRFLSDGNTTLTTLTNVLSVLSGIYKDTSLNCYEIENMNTGIDLTLENKGAARIEDWYSPQAYSDDGGTDLHGLIELVIADMNQRNNPGSLYVLISDMTPQPALSGDDIVSSEEQMGSIGQLLVENVILKPDLSIGIVGIQAQRKGRLSGWPNKSLPGSKVNPFTIEEEDISGKNENGVYKSPLYLLLIGNELIVQDEIDNLRKRMNEKIHLGEGELESFIVPRITLQPREKLDGKEDTTVKLPLLKLEGDLARYAIGAETNPIEPQSVYDGYKRLDYIEDSIPFYRLYDEKRYGESTGVTISSSLPYKLVLEPEDKEFAIGKEFLDVEYTTTIRHIAAETADTRLLKTSDIIKKGSLEYVDNWQETGSVGWKWNLTLNPDELRKDEPVLFVAETRIPLNEKKARELVEHAIASGSDWLFAEDSKVSWSMNMPTYWDYREHGDQFTQADKTPYLSFLFETIGNEIAKNVAYALCEKSGTYARTAIFGFVVRDSSSSAFYHDKISNRDEDPAHVAYPATKIKEFNASAPAS